MTLDYAVTVLLTMTLITLWSLVLFVLVPRLLFGGRIRGRAVANLVRMTLASIVVVHLLVVLHVFDLFSLSFGLMVVGALHARLVRRTSVVASLSGAWRRSVVGSLDLLDNGDHRADLRRQVERNMRLGLRRLKVFAARAITSPWSVLFLAVVGATVWLRLGDAFRHPASDLPDYGIHLGWLKALAGNHLYIDGVYPRGAEALLQVVRRVVAVDEGLLVRMAPGMLECLTTGLIYWAVRRLGGRTGPALVGAALFGVFAVAGWLPVVGPPNGDGIGMTMALVFVPPVVVFAAEATAGGGRSAVALVMEAMACIFLIQPFVGVVVLAGLVGSCFVALGLGGRALRRAALLAAVSAAAGLLALVPLAVALAAGRHLVRAVLPPAQLFLGIGVRLPSIGAPLPLDNPILVAASVACGIGIVLIRSGPRRRVEHASDHGRLVLAGVLLTTVVLAFPTRFSLPSILAPNEVGRVLTPVACMVLAVALDDVVGLARRWLAGGWWRRGRVGSHVPGPLDASAGSFALTAAILIGLTALAVPLSVRTGEREQPDAAILQLGRIDRQFSARTWTVVSSAASLPRVRGNGFFSEQSWFLTHYQPEIWRYDPRRPDLALPPPETFIFVRTRPIVAPLDSSLDAAVSRAAPFVNDDVAARPGLLSWVKRYQATHDDLTTYHRETGLIVFWIHRSHAEEEAVLRRIDQERRRR